MSNLLLFSKLSALPQKLKVEIIDYIEFLEKNVILPNLIQKLSIRQELSKWQMILMLH